MSSCAWSILLRRGAAGPTAVSNWRLTTSLRIVSEVFWSLLTRIVSSWIISMIFVVSDVQQKSLRSLRPHVVEQPAEDPFAARLQRAGQDREAEVLEAVLDHLGHVEVLPPRVDVNDRSAARACGARNVCRPWPCAVPSSDRLSLATLPARFAAAR